LAGAFAQSFRDSEALGHGVRLLYVAVTRARRSLAVTIARNLRYTSLGHVVGPVGTFPDQLADAFTEANVPIERDPA
jgi:ATP-dependent exoDNAse (exonuclease V) beta subunit